MPLSVENCISVRQERASTNYCTWHSYPFRCGFTRPVGFLQIKNIVAARRPATLHLA